MAYLIEAFPSRAESNFDFLFDRLKDLGDSAFKWAVLDMVDKVQKLYPDDNVIAMIRERGNEYEKQKRDGTPFILTDERWTPPPQEWTELKKTLGLKNAEILATESKRQDQ